MRTLRNVIVGAVLLGGAIAIADKAVTYLSAGAAVDSMLFRPNPAVTGGIIARVCGHTTIQGGGVTQGTCYDVTLAPTDPIAVSVNSLGGGAALTFWKTREGL